MFLSLINSYSSSVLANPVKNLKVETQKPMKDIPITSCHGNATRSKTSSCEDQTNSYEVTCYNNILYEVPCYNNILYEVQCYISSRLMLLISER